MLTNDIKSLLMTLDSMTLHLNNIAPHADKKTVKDYLDRISTCRTVLCSRLAAQTDLTKFDNDIRAFETACK